MSDHLIAQRTSCTPDEIKSIVVGDREHTDVVECPERTALDSEIPQRPVALIIEGDLQRDNAYLIGIQISGDASRSTGRRHAAQGPVQRFIMQPISAALPGKINVGWSAAAPRHYSVAADSSSA
ncbi:MAG: hypothetical protein H0T91_06475 [Propionibacteriaceae bacterium]|nr:hypothetical protein [Propionibacteriaceae bacterium]